MLLEMETIYRNISFFFIRKLAFISPKACWQVISLHLNLSVLIKDSNFKV